ncbi:MAG: hypothetical protein IPK73_17410 [Candidatus Obscuribacter sp.]|nr:hypothetical protein [Candidatus Obscuribacter sp.]MBK9278587.1 hypothetical protein [Candidatus Obscuribacter sp.]
MTNLGRVLPLSLSLQLAFTASGFSPLLAQAPAPSPLPAGKPVAPPLPPALPKSSESPRRITRPAQNQPAAALPTRIPRRAHTTDTRPDSTLKPQVPSVDVIPNTVPSSGQAPAPAPAPVAPPAYQTPKAGNAVEQYPTIGRLEEVTLGRSQPGAPIAERLSTLETVVFKRNFNDDSLFDRTERLKRTILGGMEAERADLNGNNAPPVYNNNDLENLPTLETVREVNYLDELALRPENLQPSTPEQVGQFAVEIINTERRNYGLGALSPDTLAEKLAREQAAYQGRRSLISHFNEAGLGPDRRYTLEEGSDALTECIASVKTAEVGASKVCKAGAVKLLKLLLSRQDDRDAILSPDATHIGFAICENAGGDRFIGTCEILNRHSLMGPLPSQAALGEKVEVKGVFHSPYVFDRVTLAFEALAAPNSSYGAADEGEEALPYFPPLDYVAYSNRSERDYSKAVTAIKIGGMVAAVAGGMFFPPIALAAPLIAVAGSPGEPRPVSDIPVKGGVKIDGAAFSVKVPLNNENKEGLYYITVWGTLGKGQKSIPISRRVIEVKAVEKEVEAVKTGEHDVKDAAPEGAKLSKQERKLKHDQEKALKEKEKQERELKEKQEKAARKAREKAGKEDEDKKKDNEKDD